MNDDSIIEDLDRQRSERAKVSGSFATGGTIAVFAVLLVVAWWRLRK